MIIPPRVANVLLNSLNNIGGSNHVAGIARIALIILAFNSQAVALSTDKIALQVTALIATVKEHETRLTGLESFMNSPISGISRYPLKDPLE